MMIIYTSCKFKSDLWNFKNIYLSCLFVFTPIDNAFYKALNQLVQKQYHIPVILQLMLSIL